MIHGLDNRHLYAAYRLDCTFSDGSGRQIDGTGTGFFVRSGDGKQYLVTNRHVVDIAFNCPQYQGFNLREVFVSGKRLDVATALPDVDQRYQIVQPNLRYSNVPENDIACMIDPRIFVPDGNPTMTVDFFLGHDLLATHGDFERDISVCDFVAFPGYPEWHDIQQRRPILRTGTVSSDPRYDYRDLKGNYIGQCIAYEAFSSGGSSGSPVFTLQKGIQPGEGISFPAYRPLKLIGINASHLPAKDNSHSGISIMYKSSAILDMIDA